MKLYSINEGFIDNEMHKFKSAIKKSYHFVNDTDALSSHIINGVKTPTFLTMDKTWWQTIIGLLLPLDNASCQKVADQTVDEIDNLLKDPNAVKQIMMTLQEGLIGTILKAGMEALKNLIMFMLKSSMRSGGGYGGGGMSDDQKQKLFIATINIKTVDLFLNSMSPIVAQYIKNNPTP